MHLLCVHNDCNNLLATIFFSRGVIEKNVYRKLDILNPVKPEFGALSEREIASHTHTYSYTYSYMFVECLET